MELKTTYKNILAVVFYIAIIAGYAKLFITGEIFLYLRPVYAYLSFLVYFFFITLILFSLFQIARRNNKDFGLKLSYILLLIPFIAAFTHTPQSFSSETIKRKLKKYNLANDSTISTKPTRLIDKTKETLIIDKMNFYFYLNEFYENQNHAYYIESNFTISGIYFHEAEWFNKDQAFIGRLVMVCCAADAVMDGFYLQFENGLPELEPGKWIEVNGILEYKDTMKDGTMPVFSVRNYREIAEEESKYIIPDLSFE
jgi:putative membrane protein